MIGYHSIYLEPEPADICERWTDGRSEAFVWDVAEHGRLPAAFDSCDVLYADLPWLAGYHGYLDRAGATRRPSFKTFMGAVGSLLSFWSKPAVLVTGAHAKRLLPPAAQELPVRMPVASRQQAVAYVYGMGLTVDWDMTDGLLNRLAHSFTRVGDFCAGYGWAPRAFIRAGGTFVASDINPQCVGYIAAHAAEWGSDVQP